MRLIDADALLRALALEPMENRTYCRANEIVLDQPTAYDIDEKVSKLEELIEENVGYLRATPEANAYIKAIRDAIEIVKGGAE